VAELTDLQTWARVLFDGVLAVEPPPPGFALVVEDDCSEETLTFPDMSSRSAQVAGCGSAAQGGQALCQLDA